MATKHSWLLGFAPTEPPPEAAGAVGPPVPEAALATHSEGRRQSQPASAPKLPPKAEPDSISPRWQALLLTYGHAQVTRQLPVVTASQAAPLLE